MFIKSKDKNNNYILREYSYTLTELHNNTLNKYLEYAMWSNDFLIVHMGESLYFLLIENCKSHRVWIKYYYLCFMRLFQKLRNLENLLLLIVKLKKYIFKNF